MRKLLLSAAAFAAIAGAGVATGAGTAGSAPEFI